MTLFLALVPAFVTIAFQASADISGKYGCTGTDVGGAPYSINLDVKAAGPHYALTWSTSEGVVGGGVGMVRDGSLFVYFENAAGPGFAVYSVERFALSGRWAPFGANDTWPEICVAGGQARTV